MQDSYYPPFATVCGQCGVVELKYLHHVRHCATFRRLCTTCVLQLHPQCFCPTCLEVYDRSPPIDTVVCCKCYSSSHPACLSPAFSGTMTSTMTLSRCSSVCASCENPNLLVLNLNRVESSDGGRVAEVVAANEAVKRAEEAANARKSAGEVLDHLARLMVKEKSDKKVGNVGAGVGVVDVNHMDNVDGKGDVSGKVLEPLNAVELEVGKEVVKVVVVVGGKKLGADSVCGNGCVNDDMLVKVVENGQEHCCGDVVVV
ncbi:putative chromatin regulator PHD family [Helianthus annuus]|uniref:Chromatin regulator PHD family n=1 Tax=Helianthus annuus TaxID=4232 RepID=A0A9K3N7Y0_HELAN|nr:putative chromatin regulator PHD family [Helianthus annuus]KAJ0533070.1 putative chromatin regulator PHD family [Helianthus annuus]KAJ0541433.1 putative chromatin regulator PHD family [Helianthus annuus]KAJ0706512.1 putative chromatin regulator PHD family [Helianthus annuus]KAJ0710545.1 putative chromatin regulator PHD family [Helianthus annuus]